MKAALSVVLALLLAACESTGPGGGLRVETDQSVYPLPGPATVQFTVRNTGSATVALPTCGSGVLGELQRREGSEWVRVTAGPCPALAIYAPIVLAPGETANGNATVSIAGQYRIGVMVADAVGGEFTGAVASPAFEVRWLED